MPGTGSVSGRGSSPVGKYQDEYQGEKVERGLPHGPFFGRRRDIHLLFLFDLFLFAIDQRHDEPDDNSENNGPYGTGQSHFKPQDLGRQNDGQNAYGRT